MMHLSVACLSFREFLLHVSHSVLSQFFYIYNINLKIFLLPADISVLWNFKLLYEDDVTLNIWRLLFVRLWLLYGICHSFSLL